ncbi:hypothetical protein Tco_1164100 [Tanacetum coccineum]
MNPTAQQITLDNALVAPENQVKIGICNMRSDSTKSLKESTYQVVLDALALTTCYPAFLITAEVPEIYMHQFWHTITKIKNSSSYKFKLDKKKCIIDVEVLLDILQICPRLSNQEFVIPPSSDPEISSTDAFLGKPQVLIRSDFQEHKSSRVSTAQRLQRKYAKCLLLLVHNCSAEVNAASENMLEVTTASEYQVNAANDRLCTMGSHREWCNPVKKKIVEGVMTKMPITTAEEKTQRRLEVKARSTLMMGGMDIK